MGIELDLILRLRYEFSKNQEYFQNNDKKRIVNFYYLLDEVEKHMKYFLDNNSKT